MTSTMREAAFDASPRSGRVDGVASAYRELPADSIVLQRVKKLAPDISSASAETEKNRGLAPELMEKLRDAGVFRMLIPKSRGGEELNQLQACRVIEELSKADGSAGWNAMVLFGFNVALSRYPKSVADKVLARSPDVLLRGAQAPLGRAVETDGGYIFSGQWPFASGSFQPEWIMASGIVFKDGAPKMLPQGMPEIRIGLLPFEEVELLDTWYTVGMNGSASHDFVVKDRYVPAEFTTNIFDATIPSSLDAPWLQLPFFPLAGPTHSAVALGIAEGALEEVLAAAPNKKSAFDPTARLSKDPIFQHNIGQYATSLYALRAAQDQCIRDNLPFVETGQIPTAYSVARSNALVAQTNEQCMAIIDGLFAMMGSAPVYSKSGLQRRWRDMRVAAQHVAASAGSYRTFGGLLAGDDVKIPGGFK